MRILVTTDNGPVFDGLRGHILDPFCFVEVHHVINEDLGKKIMLQNLRAHPDSYA